MNFLLWSIFFIVGNCSFHQLSQLPDNTWLFVLIIFLIPQVRKQTALIGFAGGFLWTWMIASHYLQTQLPREMIKQDVEVIGQIISIPQVQEHQVSFDFRVQSLKFNQKFYSAPSQLRLNWFSYTQDNNVASMPTLKVGQTWQLTVRLKPPHGFMSPGATDYSQHLFAQHIDAVGYVHSKITPILISEDIHWRDKINKQREKIWLKLHELLNQEAQGGIIAALALGERADISDQEWEILQSTGTSHLVAISGLHVGLVAGLVITVMTKLWKQIPFLTQVYPAKIAASVLGLCAAMIYSALAGFSVPTQRALIMLILCVYGVMQRQAIARVYILLSAAVLILIYDPLATLSVSFWLSFIAVAAIFYLMQGRSPPNDKFSKYREWGRLQWGISCLLIPITLWYFQQTPLVSPLANAIAIPWVSFIVVPFTLLGCLLLPIWPWLAEILLLIATECMQILWILLEWFADWPHAVWPYTITNIGIYFCMIVAALLLFMPKGMPGKHYVIFVLLPVLWMPLSRPLIGEVWVDALDVGQGLSILVRTHQYNLLFDTGDKLSEQFNAAKSVIIPFLRTTGVNSLDTMIVSHADRDHMGGAEIILQHLNVKHLYAGDGWRSRFMSTQPCSSVQSWYWDNVHFQILHPDKPGEWQGNNASCVLKVSTGLHSILITGDIESKAENHLVRQYADLLPSTILVAGHHGSASSSSKRFIQAVNPQYVIYAAGYLNRFNFPNRKVAARLAEQGIISRTTGIHGTIHWVFDSKNLTPPQIFREKFQRYWHALLN